MTTGRTPHWPETEDWTGFLLVIVPVGPLPVQPAELCRRVRARIETDPVLFDLVTVSHTARIDPGDDTGSEVRNAVAEAAMPGGHYFAPRGVIGVMFVAIDKEAVRAVYETAAGMPPGERFWNRTFGSVAHPDHRDGVAPELIEKCASAIEGMVTKYEERPAIAESEQDFLDRVTSLPGVRRLSSPAPRPTPVPAPRPTPTPAQAPEEAETQRLVAPDPVRTEEPPPVAEPVRIVRPPDRPLPTVVYDGAEIVPVDQRSAVQKLTRQTLTDADCLDALARDGRAVGLVYFVFVPDDGPVSRHTARRRNAITLELDQLFATVGEDRLVQRPARLAVEVLAATAPVQKFGVLRAAGEAAESAFPKSTIEYFSLTESVGPLLAAAHRTARGLQGRGLEVASVHFVFLATIRFPVDEAAAGDWSRLLDQARVTWIDFGAAGGPAGRGSMPQAPFGLHVLSDKEDVITLVKQQSAPLYGYGYHRYRPWSTPPERDPEPGPPEPAPKQRRWPGLRKKKTAE